LVTRRTLHGDAHRPLALDVTTDGDGVRDPPLTAHIAGTTVFRIAVTTIRKQEGLVHGVVTIIVYLVTDLLRGLGPVATKSGLTQAHGDAFTGAEFVLEIAIGGPHTVVGDAVAVLIEAVAQLFFSRRCVASRPPRSGIAGLLADTGSEGVARFTDSGGPRRGLVAVAAPTGRAAASVRTDELIGARRFSVTDPATSEPFIGLDAPLSITLAVIDARLTE